MYPLTRPAFFAAILVLSLLFIPADAGAQPQHAARVPQRTVLRAQGNGPDQVHNTAAFTVPGAWQVHYIFSCVDRPGRPSIFSIVLTNPRNTHRAVRLLVTTIGSQGQGTARERGAGKFRLRIVSPCVWNLQVMR